MRHTSMLVLMAGLAGCANSIPAYRVELTPTLEATATDVVRRKLKDPYSAQFSELAAGKDQRNGATIVCGRVNAKNAFGGYVGATAFHVAFVDGVPSVTALDNGGEGPLGAAATLCRMQGLMTG